MLVRYLIDGSVLHHDRLLLKLKQWEGTSSAHLKEDVGRIEVSHAPAHLSCPQATWPARY